MMAPVHIKGANTQLKLDNNNNNKLHYMPCKIHSDGIANVSQYFQPFIDKQGDKQVLNASFRGYPLQGQIIEIPKDYNILVVQEKSTPFTDGVERNLFVTHCFKTLTYWNWDKIPTRNDSFISAIEWIDVSEALHSPLEETDG